MRKMLADSALSWAGKTHTMHGPRHDPGIYHRALAELFTAIGCGAGASTAKEDPSAAMAGAEAEACAENANGSGRRIEVAMLEVYNDDARDLLAGANFGKGAGGALEVSGLGAGQLPAGDDIFSLMQLPKVHVHMQSSLCQA
jgi:hypothetical protein